MANVELNTRVIKDVIPIYPELVSDGFKEIIIEEYNNIIKTEDDIYKHRQIVRELENELKKKQLNFNKKLTMFNLVYTTKSFEKIEASEADKAMHRKGKIY